MTNGQPLRIYFSSNKKTSLQRIKHSKIITKQQLIKAKSKISKLQAHLVEINNKMKNISENSLSILIKNSRIIES